jgi:hypothetical protein
MLRPQSYIDILAPLLQAFYCSNFNRFLKMPGVAASNATVSFSFIVPKIDCQIFREADSSFSSRLLVQILHQTRNLTILPADFLFCRSIQGPDISFQLQILLFEKGNSILHEFRLLNQRKGTIVASTI